MTPFTIETPRERLAFILERVRAYEWPEMPAGTEDSWAYGTPRGYLRELCGYWLDGFDWHAAEAGLNALPQFTAPVEIEGETLDIHFVHVRSKHENARPLILSHGWPGSFFEFLHLVEPLTDPEAHGGAAEDAFHVVVPSLPGYGYSGKPSKPIGPRRIAAYFAKLMTEVLGYDDFVAQGGDWGSPISAFMGLDCGACAGVHLNMMGWASPGVKPETEEEKKTAAENAAIFEAEGAYFRLQSTKPQSLGYAMMDSPVGVAGWIVEKFAGWSHTEGKGPEPAYTKDQLLTNVMIYLTTDTFLTASWLYRGLYEDPFGGPIAEGTRLEKPVGCAIFPHDFIKWPPRSQVERSLNVVRWTEMGEGGHFAALERPRLFLDDVRAFGRHLGGA